MINLLMMNLDDYDDTEIEESDIWYDIYDALINGYYMLNGNAKYVPESWKLTYNQIFSLERTCGFYLENISIEQMKYVQILANFYHTQIRKTRYGVELILC